MSNLSSLTTIDSLDLAAVIGGRGETWEGVLGDAGNFAGGAAGATLGSSFGPAGTFIGGGLGAVGGGALGRSIGRSLDNPGPAPTGGVNGGNGPEQMSP